MMKWFNSWGNNCRYLLAADALSPAVQRRIMIVMILLCALVRIATVDAPAIDRTQWKEIDYIVISENYFKNGFNFFKPEINWPAEPPRVTALEFPLVPYVTAFLYPLAGINAYSVRWLTLLSFLLLTVYVFLLARRELGPMVGLLSALTVSIMPLYHPFGNMLFSEPAMTALCVMSLYYFNEWSHNQKMTYWFISVTAFSMAVALKLEPLYLLLMFAFIAFRKYGPFFFKERYFLYFVAGALSISVVWYPYSYYLSKTSIDVYGIFGGIYGGHDKFQSLTMLFDTDWLQTMLGRMRGIGGKIGIPLLVLGMFVSLFLRINAFFMVYLLAVMAYIVIVAEGHYDAPYRQFAIFTPFSVFIALGSLGLSAAFLSVLKPSLERPRPPLYRYGCLAVAFFMVSLILIQKGDEIFRRDPMAPTEPHRWGLARELNKYAGNGDKIITLGEYTVHKGGNDLSPVIYYYSGLQGWSLQQGDWQISKVEGFISRGAKFLVATQMRREPRAEPFLRQLSQKAKILYEDSDQKSIIMDLRNWHE